jgi:hypothetical protein
MGNLALRKVAHSCLAPYGYFTPSRSSTLSPRLSFSR